MTSDVALTGGSGLVGGHLLRALVARGDSVRALVRSEESAGIVAAAGATPIVVDLFDHDGVRDAVWGAATLFHVAGVNTTCTRDPAPMDRVNIEGTRAVVASAAEAGVGRVVFTSSAAAIGEREGMVGTEATVHSGDYLSPYARSKHLAEMVAFEEAERVGVDLVAVNPSSVQGPGRAGGSAKILLYALRAKRPILVDTHVSVVDIDDCTRGHLAAAEHGRRGERYLLSGFTMSVRDFIAAVEEVSTTSIRPRWVSEGVVRSLGGTIARMAGVASNELCPELIATLLHGHRFDGSKAVRDLGIAYATPAETIGRTIRWFASEGLLD